MSLEEEKELEIIESNIEFNTSTGRFCSSLPWTENRKYLEFNESMAYAVISQLNDNFRKKVISSKKFIQLKLLTCSTGRQPER